MNKEEINKNLELYNKFGVTPKEAQKPIQGGRLNGMTDINPMYRIKALTEQFGAVGFGWYYEITNKWLEQGADGVIGAFVDINLYVKYNGEWSKPIHGTGGSTFVAKESKGLYTDDEAYKKALTDAISIACKSLGMCADIYYAKDSKFGTKYDTVENKQTYTETKPKTTTITKSEEKIDMHSKVGGNGKYKDKTWLEVHTENPTYLNWCIENAKTETSKKKFEEILNALNDAKKNAINMLSGNKVNKEEKGEYITISDKEINTLFN